MPPKFEARMAADGEEISLLMYGPIGRDYYGDGSRIDAKAVVEKLNAHPKVKTVRMQIASVGGDPFHAMAMYSALKDHPARVIGTIDGLCASSMTVVVAACDEIEMSDAGLFMIHEAKWGTYGTAAEQQASLDATNAMNAQVAGIYAARSGQSLADIKAMMAKETWMTAQEAKDKGFVTSTKPLKTMSAVAPPGLFENVPDHIKPILAKLQLEDSTMTTPTPTPATPAPAPAVTPPAPAATVTTPAPVPPETPAPAAVVVPSVAQPVTMTAEQATQRASQITSACVLAGKPEMASKYIDDPAQTAQGVQAALFAVMCAERAPAANSGGGAGDQKPANPNAKFEAEFDESASVYADMGLSKEQYVKSRRIDEGMDKLSLVPVAAK